MGVFTRIFNGGGAVFALLLLFACSSETGTGTGAAPADATSAGPVVLAASSLQEVLEEIAGDWEKHGHAPVQLSFASSAALARQIENGAPADVFMSADQQWMDYLEERKALRPEGPVAVATNSLVLIGPSAGGLPSDNAPTAKQGQAGPDDQGRSIAESLAALGTGRLAMGDPVSVPAGRYGKAALRDMGVWAAVAPKTVPAENVRAALALVARGEAALGIVYATDAKTSRAVRTIGTFPASSHPPIVYPAAVLAGSRNPDAAPFFAYLSSKEAQAAFARHGFGMPGR